MSKESTNYHYPKLAHSIITAIKSQNIKQIEHLITLSEIKDYNFIFKIVKSDETIYRTSLMNEAAKIKSLKLLDFFISKGASVDGVEGLSPKPITIATETGAKKIINYLVLQGAKVNQATDNHKYTPLHLAALTNDFEMCKHLLDLGADTSLKNNENLTAYDAILKKIDKLERYSDNQAKEIHLIANLLKAHVNKFTITPHFHKLISNQQDKDNNTDKKYENDSEPQFVSTLGDFVCLDLKDSTDSN